MNTVLELNQGSILLNGTPVGIGVKGHFNTIERQSLSSCPDYIFKQSIHYYSKLESLSKTEIGYAFKLAFFQRIHLDMEDVFKSSVSFTNYPVEQLDNFTKLEELFEKHFDVFDKINAKNPRYRASFKKKITNIVFKLWLCGYGIFQGYTSKTISDNEIEFLMNEKQKKLARFLATMLFEDRLSHVTHVPTTFERISIFETEKNKWGELLQEYDNEVTIEFKQFVFEVLKEKANGGFLLEYYLENGTRLRETLKSITWGSFRGYSGALRRFIPLFIQGGYISVEQALTGGIIDILSSKRFNTLSNIDQENIRTVLRTWLDYYSKKNQLNLNIHRIIPLSFSNKERTYGKIINFGSALLLCSTLRDDHSDMFNENDIFEYRVRRVSLIQLATGKRVSEILVLKKDCLTPDNEGNVFIHFHKTKNNNPQHLRVSKDVVKWVEQLQKMAPRYKLEFSSSVVKWGDDENDYRLFANIHDDGPLEVGSINRFLRKVQEKLWSNLYSSRYYTTHDFRRMKAVYMKLKGKSKFDIQQQLGQFDITSQEAYLETVDPEVENQLAEIADDGIWSHLVEVREGETVENGIPLEQALNRSQRQGISPEGRDKAKHFLEEIISQVEQEKRRIPNNTGKKPAPTGFPMRAHDCLATEMMNCGHTELHCFSCRKYLPDSERLEEHKAEVLRYMLLSLYNDELAKMNKLEREVIAIRSKDIKFLLNETFQSLFKKFNLDVKETKAIEKDLYSKAKSYFRKNKKTNPTLTFNEALIFLKS
jgi:integrase